MKYMNNWDSDTKIIELKAKHKEEEKEMNKACKNEWMNKPDMVKSEIFHVEVAGSWAASQSAQFPGCFVHAWHRDLVPATCSLSQHKY